MVIALHQEEYRKCNIAKKNRLQPVLSTLKLRSVKDNKIAGEMRSLQ